jgi:hypothetical protein
MDQIESDIRELTGIKDAADPVILDLESVRVLNPGKFEIDIVNLFNKNRPMIYKLGEGKYIIDIESSMGSGKGKKKDNERRSRFMEIVDEDERDREGRDRLEGDRLERDREERRLKGEEIDKIKVEIGSGEKVDGIENVDGVENVGGVDEKDKKVIIGGSYNYDEGRVGDLEVGDSKSREYSRDDVGDNKIYEGSGDGNKKKEEEYLDLTDGEGDGGDDKDDDGDKRDERELE